MTRSEEKPTNPKDILGTNRVPMSAVSEIAIAEEALAHVEGLLKYGRYNYRIIGVRASVYLDAARRHIAKYAHGENRDISTGVHHLGSARACLGIILECDALGNLVDDRGPAIQDFSARLDALEARMKHLRELFKEHNPKHYTIQDVMA